MKTEEILKRCDHTLLSQSATWKQIKEVCDDGIMYKTASVCIPPSFVKRAKEYVGDALAICTVIGFPLGKNKTEIKVEEARLAVIDGATELDMVINVAKLKERNFAYVQNEIKKIIEVANGNVVKVIVESGLLTDEEIALATKIVCDAGADFVKTCTGFTGGVATESAVKIMKENLSGKTLIKASGGIKTYDDAIKFINLGASRIGTSSGVEIMKN